jgi:hypothetical protein
VDLGLKGVISWMACSSWKNDLSASERISLL